MIANTAKITQTTVKRMNQRKMTAMPCPFNFSKRLHPTSQRDTSIKNRFSEEIRWQKLHF
jgi:hypothetical protein